MKKLFVVIGVLVLVSGGGIAYWRSTDATADSADKPSFQTVQVKRGAIRQTVACAGSVVSNLDVEIQCKASGEIISLPYDISDSVKKGDLLVKLDPVDEERSVRQAQVQLSASEARLAQAQQSLLVEEKELKNSRVEARATVQSSQASAKDMRNKAKRMEALLEKEYASEEEVFTAQSSAVQAEASLQKALVGIESLEVQEARLELTRQDIKLAETDVASDRIALENAEQRLSETQVVAPMAGIISDRMVQVGQIVSSPTNNVSGGTALFILSDLSRIFIEASVDESDIGGLRSGQPATISVDAFPETTFHGEVVRVATMGECLSNVVTFTVKIEVLDLDKDMLLPEMTADVEVVIAANENALLIPSAAIKQRRNEKRVLISSKEGETPESKPVETGIDNGSMVEILSGLEEGDTVLVAENEADSRWIRKDREEGRGRPPMGGMMGGGPPRR